MRLTTERPGDIRDVFSEPKVGNLDMSVRTEQNVFRLEISVDNVEGMEVVESESNFSGEELGDGIRETLYALWSSITRLNEKEARRCLPGFFVAD